MADLRISQLNQVVTPTLNDIFPVVNSAETKRITFGNINNSLPTTTFVRANSGIWNKTLDSARMEINGNVGIGNTLNNVEYIVNWNSLTYQTNSGVIEADITNDNMIIKETGNYLVSARYSSYDLTDDTDSLRIRIRGAFNSPITTISSGILLETLQESFINMDSGIFGTNVNGRASVCGTVVLRITQVPYYLAATILHRGGSAIGGTTGYPVFENSLGSQPYFTIQRLTY
jgi:hypothetical protein